MISRHPMSSFRAPVRPRIRRSPEVPMRIATGSGASPWMPRTRLRKPVSAQEAEGEGFEASRDETAPNGLRDRRRSTGLNTVPPRGSTLPFLAKADQARRPARMTPNRKKPVSKAFESGKRRDSNLRVRRDRPADDQLGACADPSLPRRCSAISDPSVQANTVLRLEPWGQLLGTG